MGMTYDDSALQSICVPNTQTVTLTSRQSDAAPGASYQVQYALRRAPSKEQQDLYPHIAVHWHLWAIYTQGYTPKDRDTITDQRTGQVWQIEKVEVDAWGQRFRCACFLENF